MARNEGRFKESGEAIEQQAQGMMDSVRDFASSARDATRDKLERAKDKAVDAYEHGREKLEDWQVSAQDYIQREPLKSLVIAAGVGLVLGMLLSRRSND